MTGSDIRGNFKSHIMLPRKLRGYEPAGARIESGHLFVKLVKGTNST